jgi:hypothetical protein
LAHPHYTKVEFSIVAKSSSFVLPAKSPIP